MYRIIYLFFLASGFSSLVFEVLWERMLTEVFGTSSFALSTLLTAFMAGMALGSWGAGKLADRLERPLRTYGLLEGGIGLYALAVPIALDYLPVVYDLLFDQFLNDFYLFSLLRFVAAFTVLIVPTTFMGATLPIVSQWVSEKKDLFQGSIGILYGINTFGAFTGTLTAGFLFLPWFGLSATNTAFALVNLTLCAAVLLTDAWVERSADDPLAGESTGDAALNEADYPGISRTCDPLPSWLTAMALGAFAVSGAIAMSYQVLWTRAYVIVLGSSTYSFTLILSAFLVGLAGGSAAISPFVKRISRPVYRLALVQFGVAASATIAFFMLDQFPHWLYDRFREQITSATEVYIYYFFLVGIVVLIPTFLQGMSFPLVVRAVVHDRGESGARVGRAYSFNTAGSIVGSFAAGFILLVTLGLHTSMTVVIGLNATLAAALAVGELTDDWSRRRAAALAVAGLVALGTLVLAPHVNRVDLTSGMFRVSWTRELFNPKQFKQDDPKLLYYEDGLTSTVTVEKRGDLHTLKANGKPEASDGDDMSTQILVGLLPYVVRSGYQNVSLGGEDSAMIGFGSGVTAGAALQWPLKSLETIEIEPAMIEASKYFNHVNHRPLQDDRMTLIESDGRNYLEYTDQKYDVIVSEPSNPWIAGVASLFTVDHYRNVRRHLRRKGVFAQWIQLYEMRPKNIRTMLATFLEVFPHAHAFTSEPRGTDLILIGANQPLPFPAKGYARARSIPSVRKELERAGVDHPYELYGLTFMNEDELRDLAAGAPLNTDDNGRLEFQAPKDLIEYQSGLKYVRETLYGRPKLGDVRPYLKGWPTGPGWTVDRIGQLARAHWITGKEDLAKAILEQTGLGSVDALDGGLSAPYDALEKSHLIWHARSLELDAAVARHWPNRDSRYFKLLVDAISGGKQTQAIHYLEADEAPDDNGYSGERGLLYAYLLYDGRYYSFVERQLERLENEPDAPTDNPAFYLLKGAVHWKLRDFETAWSAYVEAGRRLAKEEG
ncbi:MAG: fused MFS/spermidine synthase [Bradymonadaceae bacterium]